MKPALVVLSVSVAANAVLLFAFALKPTLAPAAVRNFFGASPGTAGSQAPGEPNGRVASGGKSPVKPDRSSTLWATLYTGDLTAFVARLRAAGFPPSVVRGLVDAEIEARFAPRIRELTRENEQTPYWKGDPSSYLGMSRHFAELNQIYRDRSRALRDLLGKDAMAYGFMDPSEAQLRQYGNLPQAKIDLLQRINDDYNEMSAQVRAAMRGVTLPEDRDKLALLEKEKRSDLAAVLSPEELLEYDLRSSQAAMRLRGPLTVMQASEAEFRTIFLLHQAQSDALYPAGGVMTPELSEQRRQATAAVNEKVRAALGAARYADYQRAQDREYQQLHRVGQQANLPNETLVRAFDLRQTTAAASASIVDNRNLGTDEKRAALTNLALDARTQLLAALGPVAGPAYTANSQWLAALQRGNAFSVMPEGYVTTRSPTAPRPPGPPPAPKTDQR